MLNTDCKSVIILDLLLCVRDCEQWAQPCCSQVTSLLARLPTNKPRKFRCPRCVLWKSLAAISGYIYCSVGGCEGGLIIIMLLIDIYTQRPLFTFYFIIIIIGMSSSEAFQLCPKNIQSSASGLSISYVDCNGDSNNSSGPTTLFIHGLDSSSHTWRDVQTSLSTPSIAIDCRGCGESELGAPDSFSPDALVEDVKSLVKSHPLLQNNRFVLVGHSMGGELQCRILPSIQKMYRN